MKNKYWPYYFVYQKTDHALFECVFSKNKGTFRYWAVGEFLEKHFGTSSYSELRCIFKQVKKKTGLPFGEILNEAMRKEIADAERGNA